MPIPKSSSCRIPILRVLDEAGGSLAALDVIEKIKKDFKELTEGDLKKRTNSGANIFKIRVRWAYKDLQLIGETEYSGRGIWKINESGRVHLRKEIGSWKPEYSMPESAQTSMEKAVAVPQTTLETPEESLDFQFQRIQEALAHELLTTVKKSSPEFFEKLVVDLLMKMGYGGVLKDAGRSIGRSGDEGIDGVIKEDKLGLDTIYLQAKRWEGSVGRPEIQKFVGALHGQGASKGIFITTSSFSNEAEEYAERSRDPKVTLINGELLASYMIEYDIGVNAVNSYILKKVDSDYFET